MTNVIIFCVCLILAISAEFSEVVSKRTQKESGEERVTAKSRQMMNLIARSSERAPSGLSSTASESPGKTRYESQSPLSTQAEKYDRTERPVVCPQGGAHRPVENAHSSSYSEWNIDKTWSSQEWKSDEFMDDTTGDPLFALEEERKRLKHVSLVNTRTSFWKKKKITIERGDPLFVLKEERITSSLKTTKQNQKCRWNPDHSCTV